MKMRFILFSCKLNSFSYEWLCTRPRFEIEALGNSEMDYHARSAGVRNPMLDLFDVPPTDLSLTASQFVPINPFINWG